MDVAERRVAVDEVDALQADLELPAVDGERVLRPPGIELLFVEPRLHVVEGRIGLVHVAGRIARVDGGHLQHVVAAALRLLREGAVALETLHPHAQEKQVLVQQRGGEFAIRLPPFERHPVAPVGREEIEPVLEAVLVEKPRLAIDELHEVGIGGDFDRGHGALTSSSS